MYEQHDSTTLLHWRGATVRLDPPPRSFYVYLLHFDRPYFHARHYLGATGSLDARLQRHRAGNGARLVEAVMAAGIGFTLARLWKCESWEESRELERKLKRWSGSGQFCPICRGRGEVDELVFLREGHHRLAWRTIPGRRRPMGDYQFRVHALE